MDWLHFREPVSAWSHAVGLALALPGVLLLLRRSTGSRVKQLGFGVFGFGLAACYAGSTLFHSVDGSPLVLEWYDNLDHMGIYLLIAGSITPVALIVLTSYWRFGMLAVAWAFAAGGIAAQLAVGNPPLLVATALYMLMGWCVITCYFELARALSPRAMRYALLGGALYTAGALLNVAHWPVLVAGIVGPHEVFHVFVLGGSLTHFWFLLTVVAPFERAAAPLPQPRLAGVPQPLHSGVPI
jgi:hemolysin III